MKSFKYVLFVLSFGQNLLPQSSMVFDAGTNIEVQSGADICADVVSILGSYTGSGTLCNGALPVELSLFTASMNKDAINLHWRTETEINNYGFIIERKINESEWDSLTFINGYGNSNSPKEYNYSDKDLFTGGSKFKYRLKQIDNDGAFEYSDVVEVEVVPVEYELSQNYPNPFNPNTTIRFSLPKATQLQIIIYDILGEQIETIAQGDYEAGYHKILFDASNLPSGTYIYRLESNDFVKTKKMILIK